MRKTLAILALVCLCTAFGEAPKYEKDEDGSVTLTELNFHQAIKENKFVLV